MANIQGTSGTLIQVKSAKAQIELVEWLHPGLDRWKYSYHDSLGTWDEWLDHTTQYKRPQEHPKEFYWRTDEVRQTIHNCLKPTAEFEIDRLNQTRMLVCMAEACENPTARRGMGAESARSAEQMGMTCEGCGSPLRAVDSRPIANKWIYVFSGAGAPLHLEWEIWAADANEWYLLREPDASASIQDRAFPDQVLPPPLAPHPEIRPSNAGVLEIDQIACFEKVFHFFLSPVQLGPKALDELANAPDRAQSWYDHRKVTIAEDEDFNQPQATLARRGFCGPQFRVVPLRDPWAWAMDAHSMDYQPALASKLCLLVDEDERHQLLIASTLDQLIGPKDEDGDRQDKMDLADEMDPSPRKWIDRFNATNDFLDKQTNEACARMVELLDNHAARVVEISCQENDAYASHLGEFLRFYHNVLNDLAGCRVGQLYLWELWDEVKGCPQDKMRVAASHLFSQKLFEEVLQTIGVHEFLEVLALFSPAIVSRCSDPEAELLRVLKNVGMDVRASATGKKTLTDPDWFTQAKTITAQVRPVGEKAIQLASDVYMRSEKAAAKPAGRQPVTPRPIRIFTTYQDILSYYGFITGFAVYRGKYKADSFHDEWYTDIKAANSKASHAIKGVGYIEKFRQANYKHIRQRLGREAHDFMKGAPTEQIRKKVARKQLEKRLAVYKASQKGAKAVPGITASLTVFTGSIDMVISIEESMDAFSGGDYGASAGNALYAMAGVIAVSTAVAEVGWAVFGIAAFQTAAEGAAAGPYGLIAAALIIAGLAVKTWLTQNIFEKFAHHCFLGKRYGESGYFDFFRDEIEWKHKYDAWPSAGLEHQWETLMLLLVRPAVHIQVLGEDRFDAMIGRHRMVEEVQITLEVRQYPQFIDSFQLKLEPNGWHRTGSLGSMHGRLYPNNQNGKPQEQFLRLEFPGDRCREVKDKQGNVRFLVMTIPWKEFTERCSDGEHGNFATKDNFLTFNGKVYPHLAGDAPDNYVMAYKEFADKKLRDPKKPPQQYEDWQPMMIRQG